MNENSFPKGHLNCLLIFSLFATCCTRCTLTLAFHNDFINKVHLPLGTVYVYFLLSCEAWQPSRMLLSLRKNSDGRNVKPLWVAKVQLNFLRKICKCEVFSEHEEDFSWTFESFHKIDLSKDHQRHWSTLKQFIQEHQQNQ